MLAIAARKADVVGVAVDWRTAMGDDLGAAVSAQTIDAIVSSLVLHQCPTPTGSPVTVAGSVVASYDTGCGGGPGGAFSYPFTRTRL